MGDVSKSYVQIKIENAYIESPDFSKEFKKLNPTDYIDLAQKLV